MTTVRTRPRTPTSLPSSPHAGTADPKITARHLGRQARIYVRQSSPTQVHRHPESARRRYGLAERAQRPGWPTGQIALSDEDRGKSGAGRAAAPERDGLGRLVSAVGPGEVGVILVVGVSRRARNSAEWQRLRELAALAGALIADEEGIDDPRQFNDRPVPGLRGTIGEVELPCIQARLQGARMSKVRRGELALPLPVGFARDRAGQIERDPDQEVQGAVRTIFAEFARRGAVAEVLRFFREHGLRMPRRLSSGPNRGDLVWAKPSQQMLQLALINPVYAGAYACGRRRREDGGLGSGPPGQRRRCALEAPDVLLRDHHPAYLSRESYLSNRATRRDTTRQFATRRGAPPPGRAWLHGRVVWGRRGCRMQVHYSLPSPGYRCQTRHRRYGEPLGPSLALVPVAQAVSGAFLAVIRPAEIAALLALREEFGRERLQVERQWQPRLGRAAMTPSAHRQCDQCEPENRLVARALETRWDEKLRTVAELGEEHRQGQSRGLSPLEEEEKGVLRSLVGDGATRWHARATAVEDRKRLPRGLIREVVLPRDEGAQGAGGVPTLRGGGKSGARTELATHRPSSGEQARTPTAARERLRASAPRLPAERIAGPLDAEGFTTRLGLPWTTRRVERLRGNHEIPTGGPARPHNAQSRGDGLVPLRTAAQILGVTPGAPDHRRRWGFRHGEQRGADAPVWGRLTTAAVARLAGTVAAQGRGQGRLRRAQAILGLTPEELREQARRDELIAYRARVADHGEWRMSPAKTERGPPPTATAGG